MKNIKLKNKKKNKKSKIKDNINLKDDEFLNTLCISNYYSSDNYAKNTIIKLLISIIFFCIYYFVFKDKKLFYDLTKSYPIIYDSGLEIFLKPYTDIILKNFFLKDLTQIAGAFLLDTLFVLSAILIPLYSVPLRDILTFVLFYGLRGILLSLFDIPILSNCISNNPRIYSISTPYGRGNDYFYSGHTGSAMNMTILFYKYDHIWLFWYGMFVTMVQGYVMTVTKQHLCIDVIIGFCLAHYFSIISQEIVNIIFKKEVNTNDYQINNQCNNKKSNDYSLDLSLDTSNYNKSKIFNIFNMLNINSRENSSKKLNIS